MKNLLGNGLTCIYLDQFAVSNLFDTSSEPLWAAILEKLAEKHAQKRIICPISMEHWLESSNKTQESAILVDQKFQYLSNGLAFLPEPQVAANYMIALARKRPITASDLSAPLKFAGTLSQPGAIDRFKQQHRELSTNIHEALTGTNELRAELREKRFPWKTVEPLYNALKLMQVQEFADRLNELIEKGRILNRGVDLASGPVIHWVDLLIQLLVHQHRMNRIEATELQQNILQNGFDQIPPLDVRCSLTALIAAEQKRETVNDQIDIMRISSALATADLFFTDKQRKFELEKTGLAKKYNTKIFSGSPKDLELFLQEISHL